MPSVDDLHVYGGGLLAALGMGVAWSPLGWVAVTAAVLIVIGGLLLYLGIDAKEEAKRVRKKAGR